nr:hypothetical protein [Tanacetum cinerariifolium]
MEAYMGTIFSKWAWGLKTEGRKQNTLLGRLRKSKCDQEGHNKRTCDEKRILDEEYQAKMRKKKDAEEEEVNESEQDEENEEANDVDEDDELDEDDKTDESDEDKDED